MDLKFTVWDRTRSIISEAPVLHVLVALRAKFDPTSGPGICTSISNFDLSNCGHHEAGFLTPGW